jgi:EAL domain-containing protein (putative c-di-GMP-specific phosphodiesterase class I)
MRKVVKQAALHRAIDDKESLVLFYQPIHDAKTRKIVAAEALLRQRRESGEIREASAIAEGAEEGPAAELFALDHWTTAMALDDAAHWQKGAGADVRLNLNLSPREFQEGNIIPRLTQLLETRSMKSSQVNLEITETSYIDCPEETVDVLEELKKNGMELWLDDFGTGHSTLEHVQLFPIDGLKIPKPYIDKVLGDPKSATIVRWLIALAHELGLQVIAEGIEHDEQARFLQDANCDFIQGFLYSKPMSLEDFEKVLGGQ